MVFSKKLVIVESPTKCKKIESYLGAGYKVVACFGHMRECASLDHIDIKNGFQPKYTICENKKALVESIRKMINSAYEVILATDDDREGEAIAWHICDIYGLSITKTKRILFKEITEGAIQYAIQNPTIINMNRVYSQQARQTIDLMVGYTITPFLWKNIENTSSLSAGRCQTPTLRLVYENNLKRERSDPNSMKYGITGYFTAKMIPFELNRQLDSDTDVLTFLEHTCIFQHKIYSSVDRKMRQPPLPLTTSRILQMSPYSTIETMKICQKLYEEGYITYMRTDSEHYSREFLLTANEYICKEYTEQFIGTTNIKLYETNDAHEAIRPTDINLKDIPSSVYSYKDRKLYKLIWETTIESIMSPMEYDEQIISISAPFDLKYIRKLEYIVFQGWYIIKNTKKQDHLTEYNYFIHFKMDTIVPYKKVISRPIYHISPYLSESDLLRIMEKNGIGRPSTYASLIQKIQDRKYVVKQTIINDNNDEYSINYELIESNKINKIMIKKEQNKEHNKLVIQPLGIKVIEYLLSSEYADVFEYDYTKMMESKLDEVLFQTVSYEDVCKNIYNSLLNNKERYQQDQQDQQDQQEDNISTKSTIIRTIDINTSIRNNKKGQPYIFYKTAKMRKPKFYSLNGFTKDYMICEANDIIKWIKD
jgi:DNA topoisomerase-1